MQNNYCSFEVAQIFGLKNKPILVKSTKKRFLNKVFFVSDFLCALLSTGNKISRVHI